MNATLRKSVACFRALLCAMGFVLCVAMTLGGSPGRAGVITDIGGAMVWFDAEQINGLADTDPIATWVDGSGNGRNATQALAARQPAYVANGLNNRPVVAFSGTGAASDLLATGSIPSSNDFTKMLVWRLDDGAPASDVIPFAKFDLDAATPALREWVFWRTGGNLTTSTSQNGTARLNKAYTAATSAAPASDFALDIVVKGGTAAPLWQNGAQDNGGVALHATLHAGGSAVSLGTSVGATTSNLIGKIAEAVAYSRAINDGERIVAQNYLAAKWGRDLVNEDFYAGDGNGLGDYDSDVIGIGQANGGKLASSHGSGLRISELAGSLSADGLFALAGHKITSNDLGMLGGVTDRWSRVWYVDRTGELSAVLQFDFSDGGLAAPAPGFTYSLLYSSTNAFDFSVMSVAATVSDDQVSFALPAGFADGYYTLGIAVPEPGSCALAGLALAGMAVGQLARKRRHK